MKPRDTNGRGLPKPLRLLMLKPRETEVPEDRVEHPRYGTPTPGSFVPFKR